MLLRALRDFNLGKLTADDTSIFLGLLNDLFPKTLELVPRAVDHVFDGKVRALFWCCLFVEVRGWMPMVADDGLGMH